MKRMFVTLLLFILLVASTACETSTNVLTCGENQKLVDNECIDENTDDNTVLECREDQELVGNVCQDKVVVPECTDTEMLVENECIEITPYNKLYSVEELLEDFNQAVSLLANYSTLTFAEEEDILAVVNTQRALITEPMTELEFIHILAPVIKAHRCGHTEILASDDLYDFFVESMYYFPLKTAIVDDKLIVMDTRTESNIVLGSEIVSINGNTFDEMMEIFYSMESSDGSNLTHIRYRIDKYFTYYYHFWIEQTDTFTIQYIEYGTDMEKQITLNGILRSEIPVEDFVYYTSEYQDTYAILTLNSFSTSSKTKSDYFFYFENFFTEVSSRDIDNIIIDLRDNGGGSPFVSNKLLSYIAPNEFRYFDETCVRCYEELKELTTLSTPHFDGEIYLLVSGGSFSSAGQFTSLFKHHNMGTIIGEETGGSYRLSGLRTTFDLDNTQVLIDIGTRESYTDVQGFLIGEGIDPDFLVAMTIEDYLNGTDSVIDYAIDLIENGTQ